MNTRTHDEPDLDLDSEMDSGASAHKNCTEAVDYVNQLIARMNGTSDESPAPVAAQPVRVETSKPAPPEKDSQTAQAIQPVETVAEPEVVNAPPDDDTIRMSQRPLLMAADMQHLREAANLSMSGMLKSLDRKALTRNAYGYFIMAIGLIITSVVLISSSPHAASSTFFGSVMATVIAVFATWQHAKAARQLSNVVRAEAAANSRSRNIPAI